MIPAPPYRIGDQHEGVGVLQSILALMACEDPAAKGRIAELLGTWGDGYGVDRIYGDGTADAVRILQASLSQPLNGMVSRSLWDFLGTLYDLTSETQHIACLEAPEPPPEPEPPTPVPPVDPGNPLPPIDQGGTYLRAVVPNDSSLTDSQVRGMTDAVRAQVELDAAQHWGYIDVRFGNDPQPGEILIPIRDNTDIGGAGGYHYYDGLDPFGVVFVDSGQPDVVLSHEVLEILADATTNLFSQVRVQGGWEWRIMEICDPVQRYTYERRGYLVSDFVTRQYFGEYGETPPEYSFMGAVTRPYEIAAGGYQLLFTEERGYEAVFGAQQLEELPPVAASFDAMPQGLLLPQQAEAGVLRVDAFASADMGAAGFMPHRRIVKALEAAKAAS